MNNEITFEHIWDMEPGQDGAIYGDFLLRFGRDGICNVYSMPEGNKYSKFTLDKADVLMPHSNSVCFGTEFYDTSDEFPLLYSNVYNNYSKSADRQEGTCCVYRIVRNENVFTSKLVQVIKIGFIKNSDYWISGGEIEDIRPYGNFVVDIDNGKLWVFTMRDGNYTTRYFSFDLPKATYGTYNEKYGANVVILDIEDIKSHFDCEYSRYIQGACYYGNKIFSLEGFSSEKNPPKLQIIDLSKKEQICTVDLWGMGLVIEPEFIDFYEGTCYYSDAKGAVYKFDFR